MAEVALRDYVTDIEGMIESSAYDAAIQHCRHILTQYPKYLEAYRVLGKVLLEKDDHPAAGDVFQRVLSVDPEDFVARVGLSIVRDRQGELAQAIWHMERAYDLMPSNEIIQSELRRLYARRDGAEPERVSLTRSALARMYAHGDLYVEAIANLRQLLREQPDRLDLQVLLAEVLWRNEQRIEASDLALTITAQFPYCLKANLILGDILQASGDGEGEVPLRRAQAIDPDNLQASRLFGSDSVLPVRRTLITRLEQIPHSQPLETEGPATGTEEAPDWMRGLAELDAPAAQIEPPEPAITPALPTGMHMPDMQPARGEIPNWLQGLAASREETIEPGQELPDWLAGKGPASLKPAQPAAAPSDDDWEAQLAVEPTPEPAAAMRDEDVPDWIQQLGTGMLDPGNLPAAKPVADEQTDWLAQPDITGQPDQTAPGTPDETPDWLDQIQTTAPPSTAAEAGSADTSDWLAQLRATAPPLDQTATNETPDWLAQIDGAGRLDQTAPGAPDETPDWLDQIQSTATPSTAAEAGSADTSDWLAQLRATTPPLDQTAAAETPDWLAQISGTGPLGSSEPPIKSPTLPAARKIAVDAPRSTIERLVEAFSPAASAEPIKPATARLVPGGAAASSRGGLLRDREAQPKAETASLPKSDISPDAALAPSVARLSAGKEDQLRAKAEAESESRMAAIMRPAGPAKPVEPQPIAAAVAEVAMPKPVVPEAAEAEAAAILEGDISPDAALAFFARLSAGKEDQLRAEAKAEGESRMAAIMGRPVEPAKPVEPEPIAAAVAEAAMPKPVVPEAAEAEAAAILEGDISPDAALAFFARLSAGKEDQLRAEAKAEGESRMAAIMGRPGELAKPVEPEPIAAAAVTTQASRFAPHALGGNPEADQRDSPMVSLDARQKHAARGMTAEQLPAAAEVATPKPVVPEAAASEAAAILEGDISPDAALAFFARLSTGKEDQLRAEAKAEGESRMAAIMGRPGEPAKPVEPEPAADIEPVSVEELPAWLQAMQPAAPETPAADDESTDAPPLEAVTIEPALMEVTVSDTLDIEPTSTHALPEWLRDMQPSAPAAEPTHSDALPDWLRAIKPESREVANKRAAVEVEPEPVSNAVSVSEAAAIAAPTPAPIAGAKPIGVSAAPAAQAPIVSVSWWTQSAEDEGEQPIGELPAAVKTTPSTTRSAPAAPGAPASRVSRELAPEPAARETRRRYPRLTEKRRVEAAPAPAFNSIDVDPLVTQLESDKYNHAVRLELARAWWSMGNRDSALDEYAKLINPARVENLSDEELDERDFAGAGPLTDDIIADLERIVEIDEHAAWPRLLGDICMKAGDLSRALEMYRRALNQL